jgi:rhodanese-related sulfurtransferase
VLLDVRKAEEYEVSSLPEAVHVHPSASAEEVQAMLAEKKLGGRPLVAYCSLGYRSSYLAQRIRGAGIECFNLEGSIFKWANEGRPVVRQAQVVHDVHLYNLIFGLLLDSSYHTKVPPPPPPS